MQGIAYKLINKEKKKATVKMGAFKKLLKIKHVLDCAHHKSLVLTNPYEVLPDVSRICRDARLVPKRKRAKQHISLHIAFF